MQSWMIGMVSGTIFVGWWPFFAVFGLVCLVRGYCLGCTALEDSGCASGVRIGLWLFSGPGSRHRIAAAPLGRCVCGGFRWSSRGTVSSLPTASRMLNDGLRQRFEFSVRDISPSRCVGPSKLILSYYGDHKIRPADEWQFEVKLRKPWGLANPGSFNMQVWLAQRGIGGVGSVRKSSETRQEPQISSLFVKHHRLRQAISERIARLDLNPEVIGILRAITVADKAGIDHQLWFLFQQFGN